jgi:putative SOS response-associated peptidase YedK
MRRAFEVGRDSAGNAPPLPAIFPDQMAPVVRTREGERELIQMRWSFPPPPKAGTQPVANVRNVSSPLWRALLSKRGRSGGDGPQVARMTRLASGGILG